MPLARGSQEPILEPDKLSKRRPRLVYAQVDQTQTNHGILSHASLQDHFWASGGIGRRARLRI